MRGYIAMIDVSPLAAVGYAIIRLFSLMTHEMR
jgi:hypothetical protein